MVSGKRHIQALHLQGETINQQSRKSITNSIAEEKALLFQRGVVHPLDRIGEFSENMPFQVQ